MSTKLRWVELAALGTGALVALAAPAAAQEGNTHEIHIHAGQLFGDDLAPTTSSGGTPELDDDVAVGVRYSYDFTDSWALELSLGNSPSSITGLEGSDVDLDVTTFDIDAVWHFGSYSRWSPYLVAGAGYAWADLDNPIAGNLNGQPVSIDDDENYTLNAGVGAKYFATDRMTIHLEARYRYFDALVETVDDSLDTVETTVGVGWRF